MMVMKSIFKLAVAAVAAVIPVMASAGNRVDCSFPGNELLALGSYYYPEQWPEEQWDRDLANMAALGIKFTHFGEFAWQRMEPSEGNYDFGWLDRAVDIAGRHGLKVILCTPSPTPPAWLTASYPDMLIKRGDGVTVRHGTRQHVSWSDSTYREYVSALVDTLGRRYANHPDVIGWQLDNEPSHYGIVDYSDNSQRAFRRWLKDKYGTVDKLNDTWGASFWSETYDDFDQIRLPNPKELVAKANPHAMLDMNRYFADELASFLNLQADILRRHISPRQWITTNVMPLVNPADTDLFSSLDFPTYTRYMIVGSNEGIGEQGFRMGLPEEIGIPNDVYRNSVGNCFGVMELQPGQVNWGVYNPQPMPGAVSLWVWHVYAGGGKFVCNYRFRQPLKGSEQYHHAMMEADGVTPAIGGREYAEIEKTLDKMRAVADADAPMPSDIAARRAAILLTSDNRYELEFQPQTNQWNTLGHITRYYNALTSMGAPVDIINDEKALDDYPFVIAPAFELLDSALVDKWRKYVERGGNLVMTCRTGQKNREAKIWEDRWAAPVRGLAGIDDMFFDHLPGQRYANVEMDGKRYPWNNWGDVITPDGTAEVWAAYADQFYAGKAAIVHNKIGKGTVTYIGVDTDDGALENDVLRRLYALRGVEVENLSRGLLHHRRDGFDIYLNYTSDTLTIDIPRDATLLLGTSTLPPAGVTIFK